ncbi:DsbA family protein [bacterium]|nr:DsbA family protein [bacterium]
MKSKLLIILTLVLLFPFLTIADIPGRYELLVPNVPPPAHSLDIVHIVEVFSFDCGHCYHFNRDIYPKLKEKFGDKIELIPKPIGWRGHDPGRLFYIAESKGKGHDVMMMIFQLVFDGGLREQMFSRDKLQFVAKKHGLENEFKTMMDSPEIIGKMNEGIQYSESRRINSTPTLIIEDSIMPIRDYSNLVTIISALLK